MCVVIVALVMRTIAKMGVVGLKIGQQDSKWARAIMSDTNDDASGYAACERQLDHAMTRLQRAVKVLENNAQSVHTLREERKVLVAERDKLSTELKRSSKRAEGLDGAAAEVSRRLIETMETVKAVLAK